ncbi:HPF/RaiA family ribosome-associated protein [Aquabacterium sp.]|uniref:HPF/RaiA family ribosome-associated protein n=1 Tax=Aquabacterium sp. TaxID=1872578 RepID=UPI0024872820|nr:HPF/RaiA family ribosome-associated protein [Aquabacterium sp.]MDI1259983.1 HPF/RaiA family ribosome-associated protein [Aquabacterium sp.]
MQVFFKSRDPQAHEMQDLVQRRMRFVFRRIDWLVPKATVQLSDVNGPRGGIDKRCQIEIKSDVVGNIVVASTARDWRTALDQALSRAVRFLTRQWRRGTDNRRPRQRAIALSHGEEQPG